MLNHSYRDAKGMFLITHIKDLRQHRSQDGETLVERDKDKRVKMWLVEEGGAKEDSLRWISFQDGVKLGLLCNGTRPERNDTQGLSYHYRLTHDQVINVLRAGQILREWAVEAVARGEGVEVIWHVRGGVARPIEVQTFAHCRLLD